MIQSYMSRTQQVSAWPPLVRGSSSAAWSECMQSDRVETINVNLARLSTTSRVKRGVRCLVESRWVTAEGRCAAGMYIDSVA